MSYVFVLISDAKLSYYYFAYNIRFSVVHCSKSEVSDVDVLSPRADGTILLFLPRVNHSSSSYSSRSNSSSSGEKERNPTRAEVGVMSSTTTSDQTQKNVRMQHGRAPLNEPAGKERVALAPSEMGGRRTKVFLVKFRRNVLSN